MKKYSIFSLIILIFMACEKPIIVEQSVYDCALTLTDDSANHPKNAAFQAALDEVIKYTPGIQVAIRTQDSKLWTGTAGMADIENDVFLKPCHPFMVGSVSKVFTAVLIMQLHDEGILSIDDKLSDWLGGELITEIENADKVTLKQLLNHTSGIKDYLAVEHFVDALNTPNYTLTQREKLTYIYGKNADHAPDAAHTYSNSNYVLLGLVIEEARKMTLWDAVDTYISTPLGLQNTSMGTETMPIPTGTVRPYLAVRGLSYYDIMQNAVSDAATGDGGVAANTQDLVAFIEAIFDHTLISENALNLMKENPVDVDGYTYPNWEDEFYGLGLEVYNTSYGIAYGHTGSTSSYSSYLLYFPEQQVTIAMAKNGASFNSEVGDKKYEMRQTLFDLIFE